VPKKCSKAEVTPEPLPVSFPFIGEPLRPLAVPIASLVLDPQNARKHGERDLSAIAASLRACGVLKPAVARKSDRKVAAGNGSLIAARDLNHWTHYPVVFVDMTDEQFTRFAIADNRTAELSEWDSDQLRSLMAELDVDFDEDLARMFSDLALDLDQVAAAALSAADQALQPEPEARKPRVRSKSESGEKWEIVIDCTNEAQQVELLSRFEKEGLACRALMS
jgi:ParB-like chromosome segregation protein Spo0J